MEEWIKQHKDLTDGMTEVEIKELYDKMQHLDSVLQEELVEIGEQQSALRTSFNSDQR